MGKLMTLPEPPQDPRSDEGWEECNVCKGTGVQMSSRSVEVYFRFQDEIEAREFMERAEDDPAVTGQVGIRVVQEDDRFGGLLK